MNLGVRFVTEMLATPYIFLEVGYQYEAELSTGFYVKTIEQPIIGGVPLWNRKANS